MANKSNIIKSIIFIFTIGYFVSLSHLSSAAAKGEAKDQTIPPKPVITAPFIRFPDIHKDKVAFVHAGDIWVSDTEGGTAQRLTRHSGLELFPKFSPDGSYIAFTGQYDGDEQVYVIPTAGGEPKRLTSYPARGPLPDRWGYDNQVQDWTPDGKHVLFRSFRDSTRNSRTNLYRVSLDTVVEPLPTRFAGAGTYSPDGSKLLYSPIARDFRTWKRYEGGWAQDLWILDLETKSLENVTQSVTNDRAPMWTRDGIYFLSDKDGAYNLYQLNAKNETVAVTDSQDDIRWASSDADGQIAYEKNGDLYIYKKGDEPRKIDIRIDDDAIYKRKKIVRANNNIENFALSPNGSHIALSVRGNILSIPSGEGITRHLTKSSTAHARSAVWSPDGKHIAYVSDESGEEEIWLSDRYGRTPPKQLTQGNEQRFLGLLWSPDGSKIATLDNNGDLHALTVKTGRLTKIANTGAWYQDGFSWSPDSRYLAYTSFDSSYFSFLSIWDAKVNKSHRISGEIFNEFQPVWGDNGDFIYFFSDRTFNPQMGSIEWNYVVDRETSLYAMALRKNVPHPFRKTPTSEQDTRDESSKGKTKNVKIDLDGLSKRVVRMPVKADNYTGLTFSGGNLFFIKEGPFYNGRQTDTARTLMRVSARTGDSKAIFPKTDNEYTSNKLYDSVSSYTLSGDGKTALIRQGRNYKRLNLDSLNAKSVSFNSVKLEINPAEEWHVIFNEVWRRFRDDFYRPDMGGKDWAALADKYRPYVDRIGHRSDLNFILGEMVGELGVSHTYVSGGDLGSTDRPTPALLGARFELDEKSGFYRIAEILEGHNEEDKYRSPLTEVGVNAKVGDYIFAINGEELGPNVNPYSLLRNAGGKLVELSLNDKPTLKGARHIWVEPIDDERNLLYVNDVLKTYRYVDEATDGRVGYLHIPDMGGHGLSEFIKWYYPQIRRDGLIVDVRGNQGGNISQMILDRLLRQHYTIGHVQGRKYPNVYPWGNDWQVFTGEIAVLTNEDTLSDGEAFSWTFQQSKRGPIIGARTWGGVVGTGFTGSLLDGGDVRVPQYQITDTSGNMFVEGEGVRPDIEVLSDPALLMKSEEPQLRKALDEILSKIEGKSPGTLKPAKQ